MTPEAEAAISAAIRRATVAVADGASARPTLRALHLEIETLGGPAVSESVAPTNRAARRSRTRGE